MSTRWEPFMGLFMFWKLNSLIIEIITLYLYLLSTHRRVISVSKIHQLRDSRHMWYEFADWRRITMINDISREIIMLTSNKCPTIHLEMRQVCRWQDATEFQEFRSFKLHIPPARMAMTESIVGIYICSVQTG